MSSKKGMSTIAMVLAMPAILVALTIGFDFMITKYNMHTLQRQMDSATLTMSILASPSDEEFTNESGIIINGPNTGKKSCFISQEIIQQGLNQLEKTLTSSEYTIVNVSSDQQRQHGVAYIRVHYIAKGNFMQMFSKYVLKDGFVLESTSICNITKRA